MQDLNNGGGAEVYQIRKLELSDKDKGFIELLKQLTVCDSVSDKDFQGRFEELARLGDDHLICVIEDSRSGKIVATGSVFIERKFIRNCGKVGHIEDVVVDSMARGSQLGKRVVEFLTNHASSMGCYKVILDCSAMNFFWLLLACFLQILMIASVCQLQGPKTAWLAMSKRSEYVSHSLPLNKYQTKYTEQKA